MKISLKDLAGEKVYILIRPKAVSYIVNLVKKSRTVLEEGVRENLYRMSKGKKCSLSFAVDLSSMLEIPFEFFEENTILITSAKNTEVGIERPKLPFCFDNEDGARFISAILGDGELNSQLNVRYNNQVAGLVNKVLQSSKHIFGDTDYKIYYRDDFTYQLHYPKIVGLIVLRLGLLPGYKAVTNYRLPEFIFTQDKRFKSAFLRQFFDDEGNVRLKDRRLQIKQTVVSSVPKKEARLHPERYCHNFLKGINLLLHEFGISSRVYLETCRPNRLDCSISIYGKENLVAFQKHIGFDLEYKARLLQEAIDSYIFPSAPRNGRIAFAFRHYQQVHRKFGKVTPKLLANQSQRSVKTAQYYLIDLRKKGII